VSLVLVSREALEEILSELASLRASAGGFEDGPQGFDLYLKSSDPAVLLAVQARLPLPGPLAPGEVPPAPLAELYREPGDNRLRCADCGKVVFNSMEAAQSAADRITRSRQDMKAYRGDCGHYHVSRVKGGPRHR
jgi:hypothetical protein